MKISFCTTCAQRLYQLKQTWSSNLEIIRSHSNIEWVLLNYDDDKDMHNYVMDMYNDWPINFVYAKEKSNHEWHMSVAKNIVHQLGSGKILFSLDCDNFIGNAVETINKNFINDVKVMHMFSGMHGDGTCGRIAIDKQTFYNMGGYDESFYPMAGQDSDFLIRAKALNLNIKVIKKSPQFAIKNDKVESIKLCQKYQMTWLDFSKENSKKMKDNIKNNILTANLPNGMTKPNVEIFKK